MGRVRCFGRLGARSKSTSRRLDKIGVGLMSAFVLKYPQRLIVVFFSRRRLRRFIVPGDTYTGSARPAEADHMAVSPRTTLGRNVHSEPATVELDRPLSF